MMAFADHIERNAKAYAGAIAATGSAAISEHLVNIVKWLLDLLGLSPPTGVGLSIRYLFVAAVTWLTVHYTMIRHRS